MSEQLEVLKIVVERLEETGVRHMITGSIASNFHALPRMTRDRDIVVELVLADVDTMCQLFSADFYVDEDMVRQAIERRARAGGLAGFLK